MKLLVISALLIATVVMPTAGQPFVPDAVFRVFNVTYDSGGSTLIASTQTDVYIDEAAAIAETPGSNIATILDACTTNYHPCHADAICTDLNGTLGIIQCRCGSGYNQTASTETFNLPNGTSIIPDGTNCPDIDECATGNTTVCGAGTDQCFNSAGSYSCNCTSGYTYNSAAQACEDINECLNSTLNDCAANATCQDTAGGFNCTCNSGFSGDGVTCTEIDECDTRNITCGGNGNCTDPIGDTYSCVCETGYAENTTVDPFECQDVNECDDGTAGCATEARCDNNAGSFTCTCNSGYTGSGTSCSDINECTTSSPCDGNATCTNTNGSFSCACNSGFSGNGTVCEESALNFCYRLSVTFENATSGDVSSRTADADTAVSGFLSELEGGSVGFSYANSSHTIEAVLGNTTVTELIIQVCLNESSQTEAELTTTLRNFNFTATEVGGFTISVLEYDECITNYGNCSSDANCTNTDGDFTCTCFETHADRSTGDVNGTICELPTSFTCSSSTVNVTGYLPYFTNLGISDSELTLGTCSGTVSGDDISFIGACGATVESNSTHLSYKWNLTNLNESATIFIGNYVTIPVTCTFDSSQNVTFNVTADRKDIVFDDDLNNLPGEAYDFTAEAFTDAAATNALTAAVTTDTKIYFRLGTSNTLPSDVKIQCNSFSTAAADGSSSSIELLDGSGCPASRTSSNGPILDTLDIVTNGASSTAIIGVDSHFYGTSRITMATFVLTACLETGGSTCDLAGCSRRRRSIISVRMKREDEQSGTVQTVFERSDDDVCTRDCGDGVCVLDAGRNLQCVCADGSYKRSDGTCTRLSISDGGGDAPSGAEDNTLMICLIVLGCVLALLAGILIFACFYRKNSENQKDYELSHVNTHAIDK